MLREIWLTNKDGTDIFRFENFGTFTFTSPTSFGIYRSKEFLKIGNQCVEIEDLPQFKNITGTIIIKSANAELESKYNQLRDFIAKYTKTGFRLYVKTTETNERYIECSIDSLDKAEKTSANTMEVGLNILPKSLWLTDVEAVAVQVRTSVANPFKFARNINVSGLYSVIFDYDSDLEIYATAFEGAGVSQAEISNVGEEETPLLIRIYGKAVNPLVKLKDKTTGEVVQSVSFNNYTINTGYYVEINSNPESTYIELVNEETGARTDIEELVDQDSTIYMTLPVGNFVIEVVEMGQNTTINDLQERKERTMQTRVFYRNQFKGV